MHKFSADNDSKGSRRRPHESSRSPEVRLHVNCRWSDYYTYLLICLCIEYIIADLPELYAIFFYYREHWIQW